MTITKKNRSKLDYLVRTTGQAEAEIVAQAVDEGLSELYRRQLADDYLTGKMSRDKAVLELGKDTVEELEYARGTIDADITWGLKGA